VIRNATSPKPRLSRCKVCHCQFTKARSIQPTCGKFDCNVEYAMRTARKAAEKRVGEMKRAQAADIKARKDAVKTLSDYKKEAQVAFNSYIRARDAGMPCICCALPLAEGLVGGGYDCGHYRSVGSAPHLRFDERNAHGQRKQCNRWGGGRAVDYRVGLIARIGLEAVEALEADNTPRKWSIDDLKAIKAEYKQKLRDLEKARVE
jgi:hypothetical protein